MKHNTLLGRHQTRCRPNVCD